MTKNKLYIFFIVLSLAGYIWLAWNIESIDPSTNTIPCMFKEITHLPCPACGTTRSIIELIKGNFMGSLLINPFGIFLALALIVIPLWIIIDILRANDSFFRWYKLCEGLLAQNKLVSIPSIGVVIANWCWNIAKGL
jgi:hypothetical protein